MNILVTGGAGYIGSHCVKALTEAGHKAVVLDSLVYGHKEALSPAIPFYQGNCADVQRVTEILKDHAIECVIHFAAYAYVGESVLDPLKYYHNNVAAAITLLQAMRSAHVQRIVFSSSCATYGIPSSLPIREDADQKPINPYGRTKLIVESILQDVASAGQLSYCALRYFNACGAAFDGSLGEDHNPETHLIPNVLLAALGRRDPVDVYGNDYPTPDGTCLRDYIHVEDLASAHIAAAEHLLSSKQSLKLNLGTGKAYSVLEVIQTAEAIVGRSIPYHLQPRRPGDPAALCADPSLAFDTLGWKAKHTELRSIIASAYRWFAQHPKGYASGL